LICLTGRLLGHLVGAELRLDEAIVAVFAAEEDGEAVCLLVVEED
jgi:hypothetical protein